MPINFAIKLAATIAIEAASVALQDSKRTKGPRLDELTVTVADYGTPLPRFRGARRFACPVFHAEDLKEVEQTSKVKGGGKQTTYHYLATFGCAIADCPIDTVLKIWFDDKLVYDVTGTGPTSVASSLGLDINSVMRIYYGSEDQLPDPRYTEWCENKYGPDSAPAYRGVSYLFFEDMPVDNFGNRIPQVSVLATSGASTAYPYAQPTSAIAYTAGFARSPSGNWIVRYVNNNVEWWDSASRIAISYVPAVGSFLIGTESNFAVADDGTVYFTADKQVLVDAVPYFYEVPVGGTATLHPSNPDSFFNGPTRVFDLPDGTRKVFTAEPGAGYLDFGLHVALADSGRDFCDGGDGSIWGVFQPVGSSNQFSIVDLTGLGGDHGFTGLVTRSNTTAARIFYSSSLEQFVVTMDNKVYFISRATWTITSSGASPWGSASMPQNNPERSSFWSGYAEYALTDGSLIRTIAPLTWVNENSYTSQIFDPVNDAIWTSVQFASHATIRFLDRAGSDGVTLKTIVDAMCDAAELTERDTDALTQLVAGYSWTRGDVKSQMEPLLDIYDVDARPHDFALEFLPRGTAPSGTILTSELAKSGNGPRYKVTTAQDTDLPKTLRVNFADTEFDQQTNNVLSLLPTDAVDTQRDDTIDATTYADAPNGVQQKSDRYLRREWNSRESIATSLTAQKLAMEPGDVTTLSLDGVLQNARLQKQTFTEDRIDCTFVRDETAFAALNSATTGPSMDGRTQQQIIIPAPVRGFVVDTSLRQDSDNDGRPMLYTGAGVYANLAYPGAVIYQATGIGSSLAYDQLFASLPSGSTWGLCSGTLGSVASPWLWDRANALTVSLQSGSLTSVAEADIGAEPSLNLILVGSNGAWEYVNFTTATLNGDGSYTLSGFKRGRRGTEWACGGHGASEVWILASSLEAEDMGSDDIGTSLSFKAQAIGRSIGSAVAIDIDPFTAATLKPYAPASIKWTYDGTDLTGTITRRTRVGGAWVGGAAIPLSENSEAYEVDIYHGTTFKRTISLSGTSVFTYTAAMATTDGITLPTPPSVDIYQMSDAVGRGYALAA